MDAIQKGVNDFISSKPVANFVNQVRDEVDPEFKKAKVEMARHADGSKMVAGAILAVSVFFAIFGLMLFASGKIFAAVSLLLITAPLIYISYNSYRVYDNLKKVALNPHNYGEITANGYSISKDKLMNCVLEGTVLFDGIAKGIVEKRATDPKTKALFV